MIIQLNIEKVNAIKDALVQKGETISVAESVTTGILQFALASADKALDYFQGGITPYNLGQKTRHLDIDPVSAFSCNCVSAVIAQKMALNACRLFCSDWAIGITGYASPVPESNNQTFCYYAVAYRGQIALENRIVSNAATASAVQVEYVQEILSSFSHYLKHRKV